MALPKVKLSQVEERTAPLAPRAGACADSALPELQEAAPASLDLPELRLLRGPRSNPHRMRMSGNPDGFRSSRVGFAKALLTFRGWDFLESLRATPVTSMDVG